MKYWAVVGGMILAAVVSHKVGFREGYLTGAIDLREDQRSYGRRERKDDVIFESREQASGVLEELKSFIRDFGIATVGDFLKISGFNSDYKKDKLGWYELNDVQIYKTRNGYQIDLPRPTTIV